jgi:hypothetical protein
MGLAFPEIEEDRALEDEPLFGFASAEPLEQSLDGVSRENRLELFATRVCKI